MPEHEETHTTHTTEETHPKREGPTATELTRSWLGNVVSTAGRTFGNLMLGSWGIRQIESRAPIALTTHLTTKYPEIANAIQPVIANNWLSPVLGLGAIFTGALLKSPLIHGIWNVPYTIGTILEAVGPFIAPGIGWTGLMLTSAAAIGGGLTRRLAPVPALPAAHH